MKTLLKFSFLFILVASFASCKKGKTDKVEAGAAAKEAVITGKTFGINPAASMVTWEGSKPTGAHTGTVNITEGKISVEDGMISGGEFVMDMNSINVTDLTGDGKASLEAHLKGTGDDGQDDFFNVGTYPQGKFVITKVTKLMNNPENTHLVYGNLTLRDVTKEVGFNANIQMSGDRVVVVTPKFNIDRTDWGIKYGSKKFFDNLKDKFINDEMGIKINVTATANPS